MATHSSILATITLVRWIDTIISKKYSTSNIFSCSKFGDLGYIIPDANNFEIMKLRLWKIKCAGWPRLLLGEPRWEGGRGKERERDEQSLLLPARCCRVLQVLRQSCCSLPSSPGSLFLWFLVSSQKRKISGRWKILATNPICHRQRPVPQGRQRTMCGFPHQAILWEWLKWPQRQRHQRKRGVVVVVVVVCFGFVFFLITCHFLLPTTSL